MSEVQFQQKLHAYGEWKVQLEKALDDYRAWLRRYDLGAPHVEQSIGGMLESLRSDRIMLAFAAEFSRGKTELINALFFSQTGVRLLPSSPGRTTMCPTEILFDPAEGAYIRLLSIETRLSETPISEYKQNPEVWMKIDLDCDSVSAMQQAFKELAAVKRVTIAEANKLGLYSEEAVRGQSTDDGMIEIPCWRHAIISFPHPLLQQGLAILDTPGLNALGTEPELTLNMLPSAQGVVFVLAADTGVTKSDMDMWQYHIRGYRATHKKGLAVVLNKIDAMWDDLHGDEGLDKSIRSQVTATAKILEVDEGSIFPVSAKQALLAKVKGDEALLQKSRLQALERYLSEDVLKARQELLLEIAGNEVGQLVRQSAGVLTTQIGELDRQLAELRKVDSSNQSAIKNLMVQTREEQGRYMSSVEDFQASRRVLSVQTRLLVDSLTPDRIATLVKQIKKDMAASLTTHGMRQEMKRVVDELRGIIDKTADFAEETNQLVTVVYRKFEEEHGFTAVRPSLFLIRKYQIDLEQLLEEGEEFRKSAASAVHEQSQVVQRLYGTVVARAQDILLQAHKEAANWGAMVLSPLVLQIKDRKQSIEGRLEMLRKISESNESLDDAIERLEVQLAPLRKQYVELGEIIRILGLDKPVHH
ncbi:MAG TPA: dynamin family protein [Methylococcaceae bacterium]|nr:dynamin family protein [Methylococcaceae bacterium]